MPCRVLTFSNAIKYASLGHPRLAYRASDFCGFSLWHINKTVKVETTWQPFLLPFPLSRCLLLRQTVFNFISTSDSAVYHPCQTRSRPKLTFFGDLSFCIYQKRSKVDEKVAIDDLGNNLKYLLLYRSL